MFWGRVEGADVISASEQGKMGGVNETTGEREMLSKEAETVWRVSEDGGVALLSIGFLSCHSSCQGSVATSDEILFYSAPHCTMIL